MDQLTNKQKECLNIIIQFKKQYDYSPSVREICKQMNLSSPATVFTHLKKLRDKGYIDWRKGQNRTIKVIESEVN